MYKKINVGDVEVEALSNGNTPVYYERIFNESYFDLTGVEMSGGTVARIARQLLFVLNKQATSQRGELAKLNFESFLEWNEQFDPGDIVEVAGDVIDFVIPKGSSRPKEPPARQKDLTH